jgi:tetratricopeptide (TPR) repeat protein
MKKKRSPKMKKVKYLLLLFFTLAVTTEIAAQKDTITQQRQARKMLRQGNELYKKEKFTDASVAYKKALGENSNYDKANYNLGNALYQNKNFKEAIPQYELTTKTATNPATKAAAFHNIGNAMMESKNYKGAVDAFKNALRNNPNDDETRYNLAVAQKLVDQEKKENKDDKNKDKKDKKDKNDDKKDKNKNPKDDSNGDKDKDKKDDKDKNKKQDKKQNPDNNKEKDKQKPKPKEGRMSPQQVKQLLESLNNEEKKTQKKMNAKKAKGKKIKQEKDW